MKEITLTVPTSLDDFGYSALKALVLLPSMWWVAYQVYGPDDDGVRHGGEINANNRHLYKSLWLSLIPVYFISMLKFRDSSILYNTTVAAYVVFTFFGTILWTNACGRRHSFYWKLRFLFKAMLVVSVFTILLQFIIKVWPSLDLSRSSVIV